MGNSGWGWEDVLPYFIKAENQKRRKMNMWSGWTISVSDQRIQLPLLNEFQNAAGIRYSKTKDFNTGDNYGCGYFQVTEMDGFRCSTAVGYLNPIKKEKIYSLLQMHVRKLILKIKLLKKLNTGWIMN